MYGLREMNSPPPVLITFPIDQFVYLITAILLSALGVVFWVYKQTHPLDVRLGIAENDMKTLKEHMTKVEEKLDDFRLNYKADILVSRAKEILEKEKKEPQKNE